MLSGHDSVKRCIRASTLIDKEIALGREGNHVRLADALALVFQIETEAKR